MNLQYGMEHLDENISYDYNESATIEKFILTK